ncbi:atp-binding cassette sub-family f member [Anaeramoeba flamelloides]|uniref:Atp-binding cassette sub-family f member n=1 Tax=Anaeramoeba flamelloides TaxID=1746091 RepID=A0AAV7ZBK5_9EUKA|nr:atp-binding cassette sub-family f member [Anaeramoeba flamelloides]
MSTLEQIKKTIIDVITKEESIDEELDTSIINFIADYLASANKYTLKEIIEYLCPYLENFYGDLEFITWGSIVEKIEMKSLKTFQKYFLNQEETLSHDDEIDLSYLFCYQILTQLQEKGLFNSSTDLSHLNQNSFENIIEVDRSNKVEKLQKPVTIEDNLEETETFVEKIEFLRFSDPVYLFKYKMTEQENFELDVKLVQRKDKKEIEWLRREEDRISKQEEKGAMSQKSEPILYHQVSDNPKLQNLTNLESKFLFTQRKKIGFELNNFTLIFGNNNLLRRATLKLNEGRRYALVGKNGIGKTTLLRFLVCEQYNMRKRITISMVDQESSSDERTPLEHVLQVDVERTKLLNKLQEIENDLNKMSELKEQKSSEYCREDQIQKEEKLGYIISRLNEIGAYSAESRAIKYLQGVGFTHEMIHEPTNNLSGGWRMKLSLIKTLFSQPDLLLLDEPDNFLDVEGIIWLQQFLINEWKKLLIVVSHSESFLNKVVTNVIHFTKGRLIYYKGNIENFKSTQERLIKNQNNNEIKNKKKTKKNQNQGKKSEKTKPKKYEKEKKIQFLFPYCNNSGFKTMVQFENISFSYENNIPILKNVNFSWIEGSKLAIVGKNGVGKSTLLKLINEDLLPSTGKIMKSSIARKFLFSQHFVDSLDFDISPLQFLRNHYPRIRIKDLQSILKRVGLTQRNIYQNIQTLSGGEKARIKIAQINLIKPNVLLLDEPSSFLSINAVQALIYSLKIWDGTLIIVSHDERLINKICPDNIWILDNYQVNKFKGTFNDYLKKIKNNLKLKK